MTQEDLERTLREEILWRQLYQKAKENLTSNDFGVPDMEARWIVEKASGYQGTEFTSAMDKKASTLEIKHFEAILEKRLAGQPLQYALGSWGFRNLDLYIDNRVLIPRPETEILVDIAHALLSDCNAEHPHLVADLGTGSGAVGLAIAQERQDVQVFLTDSSQDALKVAAANLAGLGNDARKVHILHGSWFEPIPKERRESFSLIVANPPYISIDERLPTEVADWEPHAALYAGKKGTEDIEKILNEAHHWLHPRGAMAIEMAPHQTEVMAQKAKEIGYSNIEIHKDLTQKDRIMSCTWKP